jgi:Zn-dependent M28 family amino/carboxypeptidase
MFLGSKYFAAHLDGYKANQGIIVDMVGDANLNLNREQNSLQANAPLYQAILRAAEELGFGEHFTGRAMLITDDHIPLINADIPTIDLIDFEYPDSSNRYWHTLEDTVDKCSPESLMIVGETILRVVYQLK